MTSIIRWLLASAVLLTMSLPSRADPATVQWRCWLEPARGPSIGCRLLHWPGDPLPGDPAKEGFPEIARRILFDPGRFEDDVVEIPLFNVPFEMSHVARLARTVMCARYEWCRVEFSAGERQAR